MQWIHDYDLFLFDFDGLLVNTEELHFKAYQRMCRERGFDLDWRLPEYLLIAHYRSEGLREAIYQKFTELYEQEPQWDVLYKEKTAAYHDLLSKGEVRMMEGAEEFLRELLKRGKAIAVVTNSTLAMVESIRDRHPILREIVVWVTREDYARPKPAPDGYLTALKRFRDAGNVLGFEDSPRGITALLDAGITPYMITEVEYPEMEKHGVSFFRSFVDLCK